MLTVHKNYWWTFSSNVKNCINKIWYNAFHLCNCTFFATLLSSCLPSALTHSLHWEYPLNEMRSSPLFSFISHSIPLYSIPCTQFSLISFKDNKISNLSKIVFFFMAHKKTEENKLYKFLLSILIDFPGMCFASTRCATVEPGKAWELSPFCGRSTCVVSEQNPKQ
jgi:hypothetical protein